MRNDTDDSGPVPRVPTSIVRVDTVTDRPGTSEMYVDDETLCRWRDGNKFNY